jgi:hypothetical protein
MLRADGPRYLTVHQRRQARTLTPAPEGHTRHNLG